MESPILTDPHYEAIGKIILALPDDSDEVKCLQVKELFNNESIFDHVDGEWYFKARAFIETYPNIEDAIYYAEQVSLISNPPEEIPATPEDSEVKSIALAENTGGNVFNDVITLKNDKVIVIWREGISIYKDYKHYELGEELTSYVFE